MRVSHRCARDETVVCDHGGEHEAPAAPGGAVLVVCRAEIHIEHIHHGPHEHD